MDKIDEHEYDQSYEHSYALQSTNSSTTAGNVSFEKKISTQNSDKRYDHSYAAWSVVILVNCDLQCSKVKITNIIIGIWLFLCYIIYY
jgi:hypothetical protein